MMLLLLERGISPICALSLLYTLRLFWLLVIPLLTIIACRCKACQRKWIDALLRSLCVLYLHLDLPLPLPLLLQLPDL